MTWLGQSIMHTRGVARGAAGTTHQLDEARQGKYHFTMGPYSDPVLSIKPGDRIVVETRDAFGGAVKTEQDLADFSSLLSHMARAGHTARTAEVFRSLKEGYPEEQFPGALRSALEALALGQGPDDLLRSAATSSSLAVEGDQVRVGSVVLKTRHAEGSAPHPPPA